MERDDIWLMPINEAHVIQRLSILALLLKRPFMKYGGTTQELFSVSFPLHAVEI